MRRIFKNMDIIIPVIILVFFAFAYLLAPNNPSRVNMSLKYAAPSRGYPLGCDDLGRCVLSRVLCGGRTTLAIVLLGSAIVLLAATPIGMFMGRNRGGGLIGNTVLNAVTAIPALAFMIVFVGALGNGVATVMLAVTLSLFMRTIRLAKTETEVELGKAYVDCAIASGASTFNLLFVHILPNILPGVLRYILLACTELIMCIVGFSFIGIGLGDNILDWGGMVSDARAVMLVRPDLIVYPVIAIFLVAISFNVLAQAIEKRGELRA